MAPKSMKVDIQFRRLIISNFAFIPFHLWNGEKNNCDYLLANELFMAMNMTEMTGTIKSTSWINRMEK